MFKTIPLICILSVWNHFSTLSLLFQNDTWQGKIEIRGGVEYIHNPHEGMWSRDKTKKLTVDRVLSIGSLEAEEHDIFSWVQDIATDQEGFIYACDSREHRVQVYERNGIYVRTIGRKGKGPGELMRPMAVYVGGAGRCYVLNDLNFCITIYEKDGSFAENVGYEQGFPGESMKVDSLGNVYFFLVPFGSTFDKSQPIVTVLHPNENVTTHFGQRLKVMEKDPRGKPRFSNHKLVLRDDGAVMVDYSNPYRIDFYQSGNLQRVIELDSPIFTKPVIVETDFKRLDGVISKTRAVKERSTIWNLFVLPDDRFVVFIRDSGKNYREVKSDRDFKTVLDLFDPAGRFLKSYDWDWQKRGLIKYVDSEGYFYTNFGEGEMVPGVTKWRVGFE